MEFEKLLLSSLPQFQVLRSSQHGAAGPAGQFIAVILQLSGQNSSSLRVQLLTPVHPVTILMIPEEQKLINTTVTIQLTM